MEGIRADIQDELFEERDKLLFQVARLLNRIDSDMFQKTPRGQVYVGQDIQWKRCVDLLAEADKARDLIDELWDCSDDIYKYAETEGEAK